MIDINKVEQGIMELEQMDTSYAVCSKLADLYSVRDHLQERNKTVVKGDSEFMKCINGCTTEKMLSAIDELMGTLKIINQQAYDMVIYKITNG